MILIISLAFAIRTSTFQTWLANQVATYLAQEWGTVVSIDKVEIIFFDSAEIKGLYAEDQHGDTLIYAEKIWLKVDNFSIKNKFFYIDEIELNNTQAFLVKHEGDENLNINFIVEYFTPEEPDTSALDFDFRINSIRLNNVDFVYKDENQPESDYGVNYSDVDVKNINLAMANFQLLPGGIEIMILDLKANEKSGANILALRSDVKLDSTGVYLSSLHLELEKSKLDLKELNFETNSWNSWSYFEDSVKLRAHILKSDVSLEDVSYFASPLKGLDHVLQIQGKVRGNVRKLKVKNFDLRTGNHTHIAGSFNIPDYRDFYNSFVDFNFSNIQTSVSDIESFPMYPFDSGEKIIVPLNFRGLGVVNINDGFVYGPISGDGFILQATVNSGLGNVIAQRGIKINYDFQDSTFYYQGPQNQSKYAAKEYDLLLDQVNLRAITGNNAFGMMNGGLFIKGKGLSENDMDIELSGRIHSLQFKGYEYSDLDILEGRISNNKFKGKIDIEEENLNMVYDGTVDFGPTKGMSFQLDVNKAMLTRLNIIPKDSNRWDTELCSKIYVDTKGSNFNNLTGYVALSNLNFRQDSLDIFLDTLSLYIGRSETSDTVILNSDLIDGELYGKFDLGGIQNTLKNQFQKIFPEYFDKMKTYDEKDSKFNFEVTFHKVQPVINLFNPDIELADGSHIKGKFDSENHSFEFNVDSDFFKYGGLVVDDINITNSGAPQQLDLEAKIGHIKATENLQFNDIKLNAHGEQNFINTDLTWHVDRYPDNPGSLVWETQILSSTDYILDFDYSKIPIRGQIWNVEDRGMVFLKGSGSNIEFSNILLSKQNHEIFFDGVLSTDSSTTLRYMIKDFELRDLDEFLTDDLHFDGNLNAHGEIRDLFNNLDLTAIAGIDSFHINDEFVGDLMFSQSWNGDTKSFDIEGGIMRKFKQVKDKIKTFDFRGKYYLFKKKDNLDLTLIFDKTDISFVNSFVPKDQISNIRGYLNGTLEMSGELSEPIFLGTVDFQAGNAYVEMLGNNFGLMGEIEASEYGFLINHMYITDPEGNTGSVYGSIYHENFKNWNFETRFDLQLDPFEFYTTGPNAGFQKELEKFQILNTEYEDGVTYYGKAYVVGEAFISGDEDHFQINGDIRTLAGTKINFPMYGSTDVSEDDFIIFKVKDSTQIEESLVSKLSGVEINLKFDISPETEARIIFDESTGDLIKANGFGVLNLEMNTFGDISMTGKYTINQGKYYLSMKNLIKKDFTLRRGGTIDWTGSPYDADIDVQAVYSVRASFSEAIPDITNSDNSGTKDRVDCVLSLTKSLSNPQMDIDIQSPSNNESAKAALSRIKSSVDELNRQFFSLLMLRKFQPIVGIQSNNGDGVANALGEVLSSQLNSILNSIDENYNFNINYNKDDVNKIERYEVGLTTEFLNDRLSIYSSFGFENYSGGETNQNNLIGDFKIEYKISKDGSFRINAFNESNDSKIIATNELGIMTQGIGIYYEEDFDKIKNFELLGYFLDIFRKKKQFWDTTSKADSPKWRSVHEDIAPLNLKDSISTDSTSQKDTTKINNGIQFKNDDIYGPKKSYEPLNDDPFREEESMDFNKIINRENEY